MVSVANQMSDVNFGHVRLFWYINTSLVTCFLVAFPLLRCHLWVSSVSLEILFILHFAIKKHEGQSIARGKKNLKRTTPEGPRAPTCMDALFRILCKCANDVACPIIVIH